jgi:hypothetical protein
MPAFSPALITIMRTVLEEAMTKVPAEQATTATKAYLAEFVLKAAAGGLTNYEGLIAAAMRQSFRCSRECERAPAHVFYWRMMVGDHPSLKAPEYVMVSLRF